MKKLIAIFLSVCLLTVFSLPQQAFADTMETTKAMNDPSLLPYLEDTLYQNLVEALDSDEYFVQNVHAIYISQEYLDEVEYNTRANIYFGYTLAELNEMFAGQKYVFTLGDDNTTTVEAWTDYVDPYKQIIKNIAVGTGVILICVAVTSLSAGAGAPACTMIFSMAAKGGIAGAIAGAKFGSVAAGAVKLIQTGNLNQALDAAIMAGSEGFKWGAISGAVASGLTETIDLVGASLNGLTMNEAALIQMESRYPLSMIKDFHSFAEYEIYRDANLVPHIVNDRVALIRMVDVTQKDADGLTNLARMLLGKPPLDPMGIPYELHHVGQKNNSILAILTRAEHRGEGNFKILAPRLTDSEIDRTAFEVTKKLFWQDYANQVIQGLGGV